MPEVPQLTGIVAWFLLVLGFSYLVQAPTWVSLARHFQDRPGTAISVAMLLLLVGLTIVMLHNVWLADWQVVVTVFGWILVVKSAAFMVFPQLSYYIAKLSDLTLFSFTRIAGVIMVFLATMVLSNPVTGGELEEVQSTMTGGMDVDNIEFEVRDIKEAKQFYGALFSWSFVDYGPDYTEFHGNHTVGGLRPAENPRTGGPLIILHTDDLEAMHQRVVAIGAPITAEIFAFPGGRRFEFEDPSGNRLAVWSEH